MQNDFRRWIGLLEHGTVQPHEITGHTLDAYHGTGRDILAFKSGGNGSGSREGPLGFWFTDNPEVASTFADWSSYGQGGNVIPVKLRLRHPLVVDSYAEIMDIVDRFTKFDHPGQMGHGRQIRFVFDKVDYDAARAWLKSQGYDGIILRNTLTDSPDGVTRINQYIVFDPSQIRSRFAKFDPAKADSDRLTDSVDLRGWLRLVESQDVTRAIMDELSTQGWTNPAEVNDGYCGQFADRVVRRLGRGRVMGREGDHEWVHVDGKHYDSETPYGVTDPRALGYYCRHQGGEMPPTPWQPDADADTSDA